MLFTAAEIEKAAMGLGAGTATAGLLGGMGGGIVQSYTTMGALHFITYHLTTSPTGIHSLPLGFCTCMKTAEITRHKLAATGVKPPSTWALFGDIYRREGLAGINKGVNAVALRQMTNWGSRFVDYTPLERSVALNF